MSTAKIAAYWKARYPLIAIQSYEESRVVSSLAAVAAELNWSALMVWSITRGFAQVHGSVKGGDVKNPSKAIDFVLTQAASGSKEAPFRGAFVLADFHPYMKDPEIIRKLRDAAETLRKSRVSIIFLGSVPMVPPELEKDLTVLDWELPQREEISKVVRDFPIPKSDNPDKSCFFDKEDAAKVEAIVSACLGLTRTEIDQSLARSLVETRTLDPAILLGLKKEIIRKSGLLEYIDSKETMDGIGGMPQLKTWLKKRRRAFSPAARAFGLPDPKGALLVGVPGCGKSLTAKAIGAAWGLPLLRLDVGKVFGGLVGQSEDQMRKAIKAAEAISPCILWLDEIEKGLSGVGSSGMTDGGTTARVFGTFLTWMQEKTSQVFVIATANNVSALPPELLRKGRFDEIFFVDLPSAEERAEILGIQLSKRGRTLDQAAIAEVSSAAADFSGAELEQVVNAALTDAFDEDRELTTADLANAIAGLVPLAVTMSEQIGSLREWAKTRARPA